MDARAMSEPLLWTKQAAMFDCGNVIIHSTYNETKYHQPQSLAPGCALEQKHFFFLFVTVDPWNIRLIWYGLFNYCDVPKVVDLHVFS